MQFALRPVGQGLCLVLVVLAGCDVPTSPHAAAMIAAPVAAEVEAPVELGSPTHIPAPPGGVTVPWQGATSIGVIPDSTWVQIEVSGTVLHLPNPDCAELDGGTRCNNFILDGVELGPLDRHGGSGVVVNLHSPGVVPNNSFSTGLPMYAPGGIAHTARLLYHNTTGPKLVWYRRLDATPAPGNETLGIYLPMYLMSSTQYLRAQRIPAPLRVDGPAVVSPDQVARFVAQPTSSFSFRLPAGDTRPFFVRWQWFPNDTAADHNPSGPRVELSCTTATCDYRPRQSGRIWAFAYVEGYGVQATSQIVRIGEPELVLECSDENARPNVVRRGEKIGCSLRTEPDGGQIEVEEWGFAGIDSRGQPYRYPAADDFPVTDAAWGGEMALGGTIHVRARVNGAPAVEKSAGIAVEPRDWAGAPVEYRVYMTMYEDFPIPGELPPVYPQGAHDLGKTAYGGTYPAPTEPGIVRYITDHGPNHGLAYLAQVPVALEVAVLVHPQMFAGTEFYRRQRASSSGVVGSAPCVQADFDRYRRLILEHEGYPVNARSHSGVFLREYLQNAGLRVEDLVVPNDQMQALLDLYVKELDPVISEADAVSDAEVDGQHPVQFGCTFNFRR